MTHILFNTSHKSLVVLVLVKVKFCNKKQNKKGIKCVVMCLNIGALKSN